MSRIDYMRLASMSSASQAFARHGEALVALSSHRLKAKAAIAN